VFMGMGEPLANYDATLAAIRIFNEPEGFKIGARKMTISTVGLVPMIERLGREGLQVELSVSLHGPNDEVRGRLMPVNTKYPVAQLIAACHAYAEATKRLITFEYILIDKVNDQAVHANQLSDLLKGLLCKVNLIPCHPVAGRGDTLPIGSVSPSGASPYRRPPRDRMLLFERTLRRRGVLCTLRRSRGLDIDGACGQLRLRRIDAQPAQPV
ncbi:MAG: 23S rRNA (adenine(2503)-C(2))-methyltransferase RlmN, partial [Candidatus Omnitrophica bacterium]|nr:23S rRNA (adenine(2503)-C(2))-methyltransferase RlmN [Candidatus Omnitrophota bacterium]